MTRFKGLATGIGSLPYKDTTSALAHIFERVGQAPFWPQLPKRDVREGMVAQFARNLPCLEVKSDGAAYNPRQKEKALEEFYEHIINNDVPYFELGREYAAGFYAFLEHLEEQGTGEAAFLKCHITGPFTFAASFKDDKGVALLHDEIFMQAVVKGLGMKALWQIRELERFGKEIIMFVDEPFLSCFGSAYTPIGRQQVVDVLSELTETINSPNVWIGVHCCGNTDWSLFTDVPAMRIINFDAFSFMEKVFIYAKDLQGFLGRGGALCWGIVPTHEYDQKVTVGQLVSKIESGLATLEKKGLDRKQLVQRLLISPSCGLGTIDQDKTSSILKLLQETSQALSGF